MFLDFFFHTDSLKILEFIEEELKEEGILEEDYFQDFNCPMLGQFGVYLVNLFIF